MKVIVDFGCNEGQNINYFLSKADIVYVYDANKKLCDDLKVRFKKELKNKKLFVENLAIMGEDNNSYIDFYIHKEGSTSSSVYPELSGDNLNKFFKTRVKARKASSILNEIRSNLKIDFFEYIKIDIEGADKFVLKDILENKIYSNYLSIECIDFEIIELLKSSLYKSFKFIEGFEFEKIHNIEIIDKNGEKVIKSFDVHSSGPYGDDIPGNYYDKNSLVPYILNNGLGWKDIHCCFENKVSNPTLTYNRETHNQGFKYHLRQLYPTFKKMIKNRIHLIYRNIKK